MASGTLPDLQLEMHTVDINTADANELELLPGIGPALAKRIIEYRERHGVYSSAEDIMDVSGIGQGIFEDIKPYISVSGGG